MSSRFRLEWSLARRFLFGRRRSALSVAALVAVTGIAFGSAALVTTLSVISGFEREYTKGVLGFNGHVVVMNVDDRQETEALVRRLAGEDPELGAIRGTTGFLYREGMLVSGGRVRGVAVKGIDLEGTRRFSTLKIAADETGNGLLLGRALREELGHPKEVKILFPPDEVVRFPVAGHFDSGLHEYDLSFALLAWDEARQLPGAETERVGLELWLSEPGQAPLWVERLREEMSFPAMVLGWREMNENLFRALETERAIFFILLAILISVASLNLLGAVVMMILDRRAEIAVMRAVGLPWWRLRRVFLLEGVGLGSLGLLAGLAIGFGLLRLIETIRIPLAAEVYFVKSLPVFYSWENFAAVAVCGLGVLVVGCELTLRILSRIPVLRSLIEA